MTEKEKMQKQMLYDANNDRNLLDERAKAKDLCYRFNQLRPSDEEGQQALMKKLLGKTKGAFCIVAPFWCDYGCNIEIGENFFANHNTVILDGGKVTFGDNVIVVTPTYAWRIPGIVSDWLLKTELLFAKHIWFAMNCGGETGNAAKYNRSLAEQKHLCYMGTYQILMPENYIAMFGVPKTEEARIIVKNAEPAIEDAIACIKAERPFPVPRNNIYDRFMSGPVNPIFYKFFVKTSAFRAGDACIGCGQCVKNCPMNNIAPENGKPIWGNHCTHCMSCICYCPTEAIEYGKKSIGKPRYHFEQLKIK